MRLTSVIGIFLISINLNAQTAAGKLWSELQAKREKLASLHQEFEVSQTLTTSSSAQASKREVVLDMAQERWREKVVTGSGDNIRVFDGEDLFRMEDGGDEFVRIRRRAKEQNPSPAPYDVNAEWPKLVERERRPCGFAGRDRECVLFEAPLVKWARSTSGSSTTRLREGSAAMLIDTETGLLASMRTLELIENQRSVWQSDVRYSMTRMSYGSPASAELFALPSGLKEVKELSRWDAAKIKKQLVGKAAPEMALNDIAGKPVSLAALKGKTVLLDFWTTWCPPCRADAPSLDKLYAKYGEKDLMIVGISVSEDRAIVEKFLKEHPHKFPIALTTENEMPRPYQIGVFPTYIVIDRDGTVASAMQGDQGFSDLRKVLRKAGLDLEQPQ